MSLQPDGMEHVSLIYLPAADGSTDISVDKLVVAPRPSMLT
jgi:hypothetical protein